MKTYRIIGRSAIHIAERDGVTLWKHADPVDGAREITIDEAREICRCDGSLIYADVVPVGWHPAGSDARGYSVEDYFHGAHYLGPDAHDVEPMWADAQ